MILMSRQNEIILRVSKLVIYLICMHPCRKRIGELISRSHSCLANSFCLKKKIQSKKDSPNVWSIFSLLESFCYMNGFTNSKIGRNSVHSKFSGTKNKPIK